MAEPFEKLFGDTSELRVIESLIPKRDRNFNITEIAEESDISRQAAVPVVNKFLEWDLLKLDSKRGNARYYKVNEDSEIIKAFKDINKSLTKHVIGDDLKFDVAQFPQVPCTPEAPPFKVTAKSYTVGMESDGLKNNWVQMNSIEISWIKSFRTPKAGINQGDTYARAA